MNRTLAVSYSRPCRMNLLARFTKLAVKCACDSTVGEPRPAEVMYMRRTHWLSALELSSAHAPFLHASVNDLVRKICKCYITIGFGRSVNTGPHIQTASLESIPAVLSRLYARPVYLRSSRWGPQSLALKTQSYSGNAICSYSVLSVHTPRYSL